MTSNSYRHGMIETRFYRIWGHILSRCNNKNVPNYKNYGGRGIKVCDRWMDFINFREDMYESYLKHIKEFGRKQTSIDRIDNNGNYCKKNCQWATRKEQALNSRLAILVKINGIVDSVLGWSKRMNINHQTIYTRIYKGWDIHSAILTPTKAHSEEDFIKICKELGINYVDLRS